MGKFKAREGEAHLTDPCLGRLAGPTYDRPNPVWPAAPLVHFAPFKVEPNVLLPISKFLRAIGPESPISTREDILFSPQIHFEHFPLHGPLVPEIVSKASQSNTSSPKSASNINGSPYSNSL